jgi:hypothetical protein
MTGTQPDRRLCPGCQHYFTAPGGRTHCTPACKTADWRRQNTDRPAPHQDDDPPTDVYECVRCERRYQLHQRTAPYCACGSELRRLGIGGHCPCCNQPVAAIELLDNQEVTPIIT